MQKVLLSLLLLLSLALPSFAAEAVTPEELEQQIAQWRLAAEAGDVLSQKELANLYYSGLGVEQNYKEALKWLTMCAEAGDLICAKGVGGIYFDGLGIPEDETEGFKWLKIAADGELPSGQSAVGYCYLSGRGVPVDDYQAFKYNNMAARQGDRYAQIMLAYAYDTAEGAPEDNARSWFWLNEAKKGDVNGYQKYFYDLLVGVEQDLNDFMTPAELARAQKYTLKNIDGLEGLVRLPYPYRMGMGRERVKELEQSRLIGDYVYSLYYDAGEFEGMETRLTYVFTPNDRLKAVTWELSDPGKKPNYEGMYNRIRQTAYSDRVLGKAVSEKTDKSGRKAVWRKDEIEVTMTFDPAETEWPLKIDIVWLNSAE